MEKVSNVVQVYNAEPWIAECLDSIRAQDYADIELIVENDPQASGAGVARNRGLERATGDLVTFVDADDYLAPHAISRMVAASEGVDMVVGSFRKFGNFESIVKYADRMPGEFAQLLMTLSERRNKDVCNTRAYISWSSKNAHMIQ